MHIDLPPPGTLAGQNASRIEPAAAEAGKAFALLYTIVARLRAPDGCPWDKAQSPSSIRNNIVEEAYELVEAIAEKDPVHAREEAGDLFMLATMTSYMYEQNSNFSVEDALVGVAEKLVRRHPHVFGDAALGDVEHGDAASPDAVVELWNSIKENKEGRRKKDSVLDEVPRHLPPLEKAYKLQKKASKVGFDWTEVDSVWDKISEEFQETREASLEGSADELEEELGDLLFSVVNLCRFKGVDPALAIGRCNDKFSRRFRKIEEGMRKRNLQLGPEHMALMDELWDEAKKEP
ncbi:MAG: nucleoside triphosphate pyrophosphohydrolase [Spirochaetes bacterium]|nr:nucleoside triphosphate pyrophosphohydrolase [Spirochaetota bacterium]